MKVVVEGTREELDRTVAAVVLAEMLRDRRVNVSLTAGASPRGVYQIVTPELRGHPERYRDVHFYNFDEVLVPPAAEGVTMAALRAELYGPAGVAEDRLHVLTPGSVEAVRADLAASGGLDLVLLGLGADGHFAANMPYATRFDQEIYPIEAREEYPWYPMYRELFAEGPAGADAGGDAVEPVGVTMGAALFLRARRVVMIVNGAGKAAAVRELLTREVSPEFPATVLRLHPELLLALDAEAAAESGDVLGV